MPAQYGTPTCRKNINTLENVQKFALRMCSKRWDQAYSQLLQLFDITKLSERRLYLDLCTMFKIVAFLILTQAELKVLTDPFCFIDPLPAL